MKLIENEWYMCSIPVMQPYTKECGTKDVPLQYTADREDAYHVSEKFSDTCNVTPLYRMEKVDD